MSENKMSERTHVTHEAFGPLYDADSEVLILGSIPSPKSREQRFYYGHPQNRFWKVMAAVLEESLPSTVEEKAEMMHRHHIALWDSLSECDIRGASDASIQNPVPTDIPWLLRETKIHAVFCTGATAYRYYEKYHFPATGISAVQLPSTSPANAAVSLEKLTEAYKMIADMLSKCFKKIMTNFCTFHLECAFFCTSHLLCYHHTKR